MIRLLPLLVCAFSALIVVVIAHQRNALMSLAAQRTREILAAASEREAVALRDAGLSNFTSDLDGKVEHIHLPEPVLDIYGAPLDRWICRECFDECGPAAKLIVPAEVVSAVGFVLIVQHSGTGTYWVRMPDVSDDCIPVSTQRLQNGWTGYLIDIPVIKRKIGWKGPPEIFTHKGPVPKARVVPLLADPGGKKVQYQFDTTKGRVAPLEVHPPSYDWFKR